MQRVSWLNTVTEFINEITGKATRVTAKHIVSRFDGVSASSVGEPIRTDDDAEEQVDEEGTENSPSSARVSRLPSVDSAVVSEPPQSITPSASDGRQDGDFETDDEDDGLVAGTVSEADEYTNDNDAVPTLSQPTVVEDNIDEQSDAGKETEPQVLLSVDEQTSRTMNLFGALAPHRAAALTNFEHLGNAVGGLVQRYRAVEDLMRRTDATIDSHLLRNINGLIRQVERLHSLTQPLEYLVQELQEGGDAETRDALFLFE